MTKLLILCIEDDVVNAKLIELIIDKELADYDFLHVTNANEGLKLIRAENTALIIVDLMMPSISGLDVLAKIKNDSELKNIPVMLLGRGIHSIEPIRAKYKPDGFVFKPIEYNAFLECVNRLLNIDP